MTGHGSDDQNETLVEVEALCLGFADGDLSPAEEQRLEELLRTSGAAREHYLRLANLRVSLHWRLHMAHDEILAGVEPAEPLAPHITAERQSPSLLKQVARQLPTAIDYRRHPWRFGATALAITLALWAAFFTYMWPWFARRPAPVASASPPIVAEIVDTFDADFEAQAPGRFLTTQRRLLLKSGVVVVRYRSGPTVVIEGPAEYIVSGADAGQLQRGKLTARLAAPNQSFEVSTPTAVVRDRGTEFGLLVDPEGEAHVHVFQGRVAVVERDLEGNERNATQRQLAAGESIAVRTAGFAPSTTGAVRFVRTVQLPVAVDALAPIDGVTYHYSFDLASPSQEPSPLYPDNGVKLTDRRIGVADPANKSWVAWNDGDNDQVPDSTQPQPQIVFDLRDAQPISGIEIYYMVLNRSAVHAPDRVEVTLARDAQFSDTVTSLTSDDFHEQPDEAAVRRAFVRFPAAEARFVRLTFYNDKQWTFISEVRFLGAPFPAPKAPASVSSATLEENEHE